MKKKIVVPEGMLKAASIRSDVKGLLAIDRLELILEAALRWLAENPVVPTKEQAKDVAQSLLPDFEDRDNVERAILVLVEWQRRMFLEPGPEVSPFVKQVIQSFRGRTVAPHEADEIVKELGYVAHGWDFGRKRENVLTDAPGTDAPSPTTPTR
jgi:hypothetical protein